MSGDSQVVQGHLGIASIMGVLFFVDRVTCCPISIAPLVIDLAWMMLPSVVSIMYLAVELS